MPAVRMPLRPCCVTGLSEIFIIVFWPTPLVLIGPARAVPCREPMAMRAPVPGRMPVPGRAPVPGGTPAPTPGAPPTGGPPRLLGRIWFAPGPPRLTGRCSIRPTENAAESDSTVGSTSAVSIAILQYFALLRYSSVCESG
eukprot:927200-Prymnesium_polylepis.2